MLQALFVQQDALRHLIGIVRPTAPLEFSDVLKDGRETRNASVGHPTKFERKGLTSVHSMSRSTLGRDGFLMASFEEKNDTFFQHVPIGELIVKQREEAVRLLSKVVTQLKEADELHRKQFRTVILRNSFSQVLYAFEKISDEVRRSSPPGMGPWAGEQLQNSLGEFERLLKERGLDVETYDPVKYLYNEIQFPLAQLRALEGLKEKSRGVFHYHDKALLHFHEDPAGLFMDLRENDGFARYSVSTSSQRSALLVRVRDRLSRTRRAT